MELLKLRWSTKVHLPRALAIFIIIGRSALHDSLRRVRGYFSRRNRFRCNNHVSFRSLCKVHALRATFSIKASEIRLLAWHLRCGSFDVSDCFPSAVEHGALKLSSPHAATRHDCLHLTFGGGRRLGYRCGFDVRQLVCNGGGAQVTSRAAPIRWWRHQGPPNEAQVSRAVTASAVGVSHTNCAGQVAELKRGASNYVLIFAKPIT